MEWQELEYQKRVAVARVLSDAILADKIIDEDEIKKYRELVGRDSVSSLFYDAKTFPLAHAVDVLQHNSSEEKKYISDILKGIIISDGICSPSEAKLQTALDYCINQNELHWITNKPFRKYEIKSFKLSDLFIGQRFVFYIENEFNEKINSEIVQNYTVISHLLASIGFQFIYIPKLARLYSSKKYEIFEDMAMFLFPDIEKGLIKDAYKRIAGMKTANFVKDYLDKKMGFDIANSSPSLLVMLGRSSVLTDKTSPIGLRYDTYANLLKINLFNGDSVINEVDKFVCDYNNKVTFNHITDLNPSHTKLLYQGMYKVFFNMVVLAKDNPTILKIDINTKTGTVSINDRLLDVRARTAPASLYALIIWSSIFGDKKGIPNQNVATDEQKEYIQQKYQKIYALMKNNPTGQYSPQPIYNTLKNRVSELRKMIKEVTDVKVVGFVKFSTSQYIRLMIPPENVFVDNTPIKDSPLWVNL